ncbi:MAG: TOBE domain-containing protein, partial [Spirochaetales bacterium]|nr:TOBE domain-containing protein [Spirochaetales bacterium]
NPINKFVAGFIGTPPMNFMTVSVKKEGDKVVVDEGTFTLVPTAEQQKYLAEYVGKEVYFGVRPEDLTFAEAPASENNMQMKVSNKEPLGAETHLFLASKNQSVVARVLASSKGDFKIGETVNFVPAMDRCKFFVKNPEDLSKEINICEKDKISAPWLKNAITGEVGYKVAIGSEIKK